MVIVGTHSGRFHADEALAVALLMRLLGPSNIEVHRSRDTQVWQTCDYLVDVGGVYDHQTCKYDHHQASFNNTFSPEHSICLSSAGLIYLHYGRSIISNFLQSDSQQVDLIFNKIYDKFIEPFDAVDNGVERFACSCQSRYAKPYDIFAMVACLNPDWDDLLDESSIMSRFMEAVKLVGDAFDRQLWYYGKSWLSARRIIVDSITQSLQDPLLVEAKALLLSRSCPWKEHLFELEGEMRAYFLYCLYPDESSNGWRIQAVPTAPDSFETRKGLPEPWRGLRDADLDVCIGSSPGAIFVHKTGFIGGHRQWEGILHMAKLATDYK
jgi:uncharacterized UPF0160 family protein